MALTPKGCVVRMIDLDGNGRAEVRLGCSGPGVTDPTSYSSQFVKARRLRFRGVTVTGKAQASFVVSPAVATCKKSGDEITCVLRGDTSGGSLRGTRRKHKRSLRDGVPAAAPAVPSTPTVKPVAGLPSWWPFKKKAKSNPMNKTVMLVPMGPGSAVRSGYRSLLGAAKRKRHRRGRR